MFFKMAPAIFLYTISSETAIPIMLMEFLITLASNVTIVKSSLYQLIIRILLYAMKTLTFRTRNKSVSSRAVFSIREQETDINVTLAREECCYIKTPVLKTKFVQMTVLSDFKSFSKQILPEMDLLTLFTQTKLMSVVRLSKTVRQLPLI